ncbi:intermembrane phospholipid transport protein YdbH family protein [Aurantivibrio infirmus]
MGILRKTGIVFLSLSLLIVVLLFSSRFYLPPIISLLLKEQGLIVDYFVADIPGRHTWAIKKANLRSTLGSNFVGENISLNYSWPAILGGKLVSVEIEKLDYTPNLLEKITDTSATKPQSEAIIDTLPLPSDWLKNLPMQSLRIIKGRIIFQDDSADESRQKNDINFNAEVSLDTDTLKVSGILESNQTTLELNGKLNTENTFSLSLASNDDAYRNNNLFSLEGTASPDQITGKGNGKLTLDFIRTFLTKGLANERKDPPAGDNSEEPYQESFINKMTGNVSSLINIDLQLKEGKLLSNSSLILSGVLQHGDFFESLNLEQTISLKNGLSSPTLLLSKGGSIVIHNIKGEDNYERLEIVLDSSISIDNVNETLTKFANEINLETIQSLLSEPTSLKISARNTQTPKSTLNATLTVQGNSALIKGLLALEDTELDFNSRIHLNKLSPLTFNIEPQSQFIYTPKSPAESDAIKTVANKNVSLIFGPDTITTNGLAEFVVTYEEIESTIVIDGQLQPLDLQLSLTNSKLLIDDIALGKVSATIDLKQKQNTLHSVLNINAFGTSIDGQVDVDAEGKTGEFQLEIGSLARTKQFLSKWCTEITGGSASLSGRFNLDPEISLDAEFEILNLDINALEFQIEDLNYNGQWRYADGISSKSGNINANKINPGIVIENLDASLNYDQGSVTLPSLSANILEGNINGNNLQWDIGQEANTLLLNLSEIDLAKLVALAEYDMQVTGKVSAKLPMKVDSAGVQVVGGTLQSIAPGGEIHIPVDASTATGPQKEAFEALQNFHYTNLSGGISGFLALNPKGLLKSNLRLVGNNPDMGRPVVLNLNLEQNTYPLFQSLSIFSQVEKFGQCKR